jgi:hypothetical protein
MHDTKSRMDVWLARLNTPGKSCRRWLTLLLASASILAAMPNAAIAQGTTATLGGTVVDTTGALIPGAEVMLLNQQNGSTRSTKSNSDGFFVFAAVPSGDYNVKISYPGFKSNLVKGIHLDPQDNKNLSRVALQIGEISQVINVTPSDVGLINSGEKSTLITADDIKKLSIEGRDIGELVKILPGFGIAQTSSAIDNTAYDPSQVNITGALRSYSSNGNSANGVTLLSDGANITDPGNNGDSVQNVNNDMVEEVKVQTSNFGADTSNGPIVVDAIGKSGTQNFHGELYTYARIYQLNSEDWLQKYEGQAKPQDLYVYPGGNISGPVWIPGTKFNRSKKLTFFLGAEEYAQRNIYAYGSASQGIARSLVPTQAMKDSGNFTCPELQIYLGASVIGCNSDGTSNILDATYANIGSVPTTQRNGDTISLGTIPSTAFDVNGGQALLNALPLPNRTNTGDGYNYVVTNLVNNDLWQARARVDDSFSNKVKFFATYDIERGRSGVPEVPYYSPANSGAGMGGVDTPGGGLLSTINSQTGGLNLTVIPSSRLTNETQLNMTYLHQAFVPKDESALESSTIGYTQPGIYSNGSTQYPQLSDYDYDGIPLALIPDFSTGIPYANKVLPSLTDNVTYLIKTHTIKLGFYGQKITNNQRLLPSNSATNGKIADYYYGTTFTDPDGSTVFSSGSNGGNYLANLLMGEIEQYSQQNSQPPQDLFFWNIDWFATDSWKVSSRLTVDYGIRFEHLGPWRDAHGIGISVFDPSTAADTASPNQGFTYHAIDSSVPDSGVRGRFAFYEPRFGVAWDAYGNGKTMVRGGWGEYRNHDNWNVVQPAAAQADGVRITAITGGAGITLNELNELNDVNVPTSIGTGNYSTGGVTTDSYVLAPGDNEQPMTYTYSFTVDQEMPKQSKLEIGYVGNHGKYLTSQDVNNLALSIENINPVPLGAFFHPDPVTGAVVPINEIDSLSTAQVNHYRPYSALGDVYAPRHILYSFYNGLQTSWTRQSGKLNYGINYTWSKVLGIKDGFYNGNAVDATNLRNNYGVLAFDHSNIFNATYSYDEGIAYHGRKLVMGVLNHWAISGITGIQSGPDPQATYYANFNLTGKLGALSDPVQLNVDNKTFLGTPDVTLMPKLTCNTPFDHTNNSQNFINPNCFQLPQIGQNGQFQYPYIHGPAYFDTDLTVMRNVPLPEGRNLQFRFAAFNFINHPLESFSTSFPTQIQLNLSNLNPGGAYESPALAMPAPGFGTTNIKEGRRVVEMALKFTF